METLPDEKINKVELPEYDKPNRSTGMTKLFKFLKIPDHRTVIIHTENFVYCVDRSNDAMLIISRKPGQWEDNLEALANR